MQIIYHIFINGGENPLMYARDYLASVSNIITFSLILIKNSLFDISILKL